MMCVFGRAPEGRWQGDYSLDYFIKNKLKLFTQASAQGSKWWSAVDLLHFLHHFDFILVWCHFDGFFNQFFHLGEFINQNIDHAKYRMKIYEFYINYLKEKNKILLSFL